MAPAPKELYAVPVLPPPLDQRVGRATRPAEEGERRNRYHLPKALDSGSPVGYRTRISMSSEEVDLALGLLNMHRPTAFGPVDQVSDQEFFEECALGILSARQSTNFRGFSQVSLGPEYSQIVARILAELEGLDAPVLDRPCHTHITLSRPYRTPFTLLLTFVGHTPFLNLLTVPIRALRKRFAHVDDIPTIGFLQDLHIGILADAMERAAVLASSAKRRAQVFMKPFCGKSGLVNRAKIRRLEKLCGLTAKKRSLGWHIALVTQVGTAVEGEAMPLSRALCRKLGANLLAFRSERIQPGVNQEEKAPAMYQKRQDMDVSDELTAMCGRAAFNAFSHWTGCSREQGKELVILERVDVLTPNGKTRLRQIRDHLNTVTDRLIKNLPLWVDLPTGRAFSRNAERGRKAFSLTGQRIYIGGLSRSEIKAAGIDWQLGLRAFGAVASRSALVAELNGCIEIPADCDLLAGICIMAGPVNQDDVGKQFFGMPDLLAETFPDRDPTSLLVWTLKAKTVADPIGNEEQLLNPKRKGALVDLRAAPHEVVRLARGGRFDRFRDRDGRTNQERAFGDQENFVTGTQGQEIAGNRGEAWPEAWAQAPVFPGTDA